MLVMDGFDEACLGVVEAHDGIARVVYCEERIIKKLCEEMTPEEAWDYFTFNIRGAVMGDQTPFILQPMSIEEVHDFAEEMQQ